MLKFYYAPKTCALAVHLALEHIGAPYEAIALDFSQHAQRSPEYLRINPKGRVPALVTEEGILSETPALLLYLCQRFPQAGLAPLDSLFATAQMQAFNNYLCATVHVAHAHRVRGTRWADDPIALDDMKKKVPQSMGDAMALIEDGMLKGPWVMGEQYTVADMYLFTIANWLEGDSVDISRLPRVIEHRERMKQNPVVKRIWPLYA